MKWKVIGIISLISVAIGIFLIYDDSLVTTLPTDNPAQLAQTSIASENHNTPLGEVSKPSANQAPVVRVGNEHEASEAESWYQLGERYYQEGQLPLSLEAFSHICQTHQAAKIRIKALLKNNRYAIVEEGNIFKSDSLLVLWDKQRRQALNHRLSNCDLEDITTPPPPLPSKPCKTAPSDDIKAQLKCLDNPHAPFTVSLWLDKRGKKHFSRAKKVTIGYQINGLKTGTSAYFTLLNISPTRQLSKTFSDSIEAGKVYGELQAGQYVTIVKQVLLEAGQEYFKAIVTSEPIEDWKTFIKTATNGKPPVKFWGTVELTVKVD